MNIMSTTIIITPKGTCYKTQGLVGRRGRHQDILRLYWAGPFMVIIVAVGPLAKRLYWDLKGKVRQWTAPGHIES